MSFRIVIPMAVGALALIGACSSGGTPTTTSDGPSVEVAIAPLVLPNAVDLCFGLTVYNDAAMGAGDQVWSEAGLCSSQFGNGAGGDISYVGPCDANTPSAVDNKNYIALVLETVEVGPGEGSYPATQGGMNFLDDQFTALLDTGDYTNDGDADYVNPCPASAPCVLEFECLENGDVAAAFNLTVMGDANQGFLDLAVNFDDVFCSMKVDTCYAGDNDGPDVPIKLLVNDDGSRARTAIIGTACTKGSTGPGNTVMWMGPLVVSCDGDVEIWLDPSGGYVEMTTPGLPGSQTCVPIPDMGDETLCYALYWGDEDLQCDGNSCDKKYWNAAINLDDLTSAGLTNCSVTTSVTASSSASSAIDGGDGTLTASGQTYPYVAFDALLTDGTPDATCFQGPMGSTYAETTYGASGFVGGNVFPPLCYNFALGDASPVPLAAAGDACQPAPPALPLQGTGITGGTEASVGQFPSIVLVDAGGYKCTGAYLGGTKVLTAAHCVDGMSNIQVSYGHEAGLDNPVGGPVSATATVHDAYNSGTREDDIAILTLPAPPTWAGLTPATLADNDDFGSFLQGTIVGYLVEPGPALAPVRNAPIYIHFDDPSVPANLWAKQMYYHHFSTDAGDSGLLFGSGGVLLAIGSAVLSAETGFPMGAKVYYYSANGWISSH